MASPVLTQLKTRATGYIGSKFVGVPGQPAQAPAPAAPVNTAQVQPNKVMQPSAPTGQSTFAGAPTPAPLGFDASKWADPNQGTTHKYVGGRIAGSGGGVAGILADPKFAGWSAQEGTQDKIVSPEGSVYDALYDVGGPNERAQWQYVGGGPAGPRNDGIRGNDPNGGAALEARRAARGGGGVDLLHDGIKGNAAGGVPQHGGGFQSGGFNDQVRALLMQQLQGATAPVSADDPIIAGEMQAQSRLIERNRQERRSAAAERAAASGLNSGGQGSGSFDAEIASGYEDAGNQKAGIQAQLFGRELQNRRAQATQLLQAALASGDNEQARMLQQRISDMDRQLRASQWDDTYGLSVQDRQYDRDRDAARAKSGLPF